MLHALPLAAAPAAVFTLSDRTEARVRDPDPVTNAVALDLDTLMDARAIWTTHNATYTVADMPRFTLLDYNGSAKEAAPYDSALVAGEWRLPRARIRVAESAGYGQLSIESLSVLPAPGTAPPPTTTGQPPPPLIGQNITPVSPSFLDASSDTSVASTLQLRPWILDAKVGYQLAGGATPSARLLLPFQHGPLAEATADYKVDGHNHFATVANGSNTSFSPIGTEDLLVELQERWTHRLTRSAETLLAAGGYVARTRAASDQPYVIAPDHVMAEAAFDNRFAHGEKTGGFRADVRLAPFINRLSGLVDEQIGGSVEGSWGLRRFKLRVYASAVQSVKQGTINSVRMASAEVDAAYKVSEALTFDGGVRALYQEQNLTGQAGQAPLVSKPFSQGVVFVAVTVSAPKVRF
jgi:hypothetical protein